MQAGDDEITRNIVGLARTRPDIFGSTEEELQQAVKDEIRDKMISGVGRAVAWDGNTQSGDVLHNQMRAIQVGAWGSRGWGVSTGIYRALQRFTVL